MNFAVIDIIFIALIAIFTLRCALKGFVSELLSMASVVLGLLAALYFYKEGGAFIKIKFMPDMKVELIPRIAAFVALFLIVFAAVKIMEILLKEIIEGVRLGGADRFLGVLFGLAEGFIVVSLVLFIFSVQPLFDSGPVLEKSVFAKMLLPYITGNSGAESVARLRSHFFLRGTAGV